MSFRSFLFAAAVLGGWACTAATFGQDGNLVANAGFEDRSLAPWSWRVAGGEQAIGKVDTQIAHGGRQSFRLSSRMHSAPNRFTMVRQTVAVRPGTNYRIGAWVKGSGVGGSWLGGGDGWQLREVLPAGDFDWRFISVDVSTHPKETQFELMVVVEDVTEALWIDDVEMVELDAFETARIYGPRISPRLTAATRFYPAPHRQAAGQAPPLVLDAAGTSLKAQFHADWDEQALHLRLDVSGIRGHTYQDEATIWDGDEVRIGLDTRPGRVMEGYDDACYELALAIGADGRVARRLDTGGPNAFDWTGVENEANRSENGYELAVSIPWEQLSLSGADLPGQLGVSAEVRNLDQIVSWTAGLTPRRQPDQFARLTLVKPEQSLVSDLRVASDHFEASDWIAGNYTDWAISAQPGQTLQLKARSQAGAITELTTAEFLAVRGGAIRQLDFLIPARMLADGQTWTLLAEVDAASPPASAQVNRFDAGAMTRELIPGMADRLSQLQGGIAAHPGAEKDLYLKLAISIASRFIERVRTDAGGRQTAALSLLQIREVGDVLAVAERRLEQILRDGGNVVEEAGVTGPGRVDIRDGILYRRDASGQERPVYLVGYVGWGEFMRDYPQGGANLAQREVMPMTMNADGSFTQEALAETLAVCESRGIGLDLLLATHNFPDWAIAEAPELSNIRSFGFLKYNIHHPVVRRVLEQWIRAVLPIARDSPALTSICLSNEPVYVQSGRDEWSRPLWTGYLKDRYGTIAAMNRLHRSNHASFETVPVPDPQMPQGVVQQRLYFDWCRFNQQELADWHRWLNGIVKSIAPQTPTHAKIMKTVWDREVACNGIDPELMTQWSDIAGNDAYAWYSPGGLYAYQWQLPQAWYDLLHSFGDKPVHNSENHLTFEGRTGHIPMAHTHTVLWQGALHHNAMTTMWVWGEADAGEMRGNVSLRPGNLYAASRAAVDLNRLAPQVAAISSAKPRIALLHTFASVFWQPRYKESTIKLYTALTCMGEPVRFVSDRQLEAGRPDVEWIIVPNATHVGESAVEGLTRFVESGGRVLLAGEGCLSRDEYDYPRALASPLSESLTMTLPRDERTVARTLHQALRQAGLQGVDLIDARTHAPAWGVEYRVVEHQGDRLVPLTNFLNQPVAVKLPFAGQVLDLLSGDEIPMDEIPLAPMEARLLRVPGEP